MRREHGLSTEDLLVHVADDVEHTRNGRQTLGDVLNARDAAGVNGTHRKLRAGLADRLGGDDAHRGADGNRATGGKVPTVALLAHAVLGTAGEERPQLHLGEAGVNHLLEIGLALDVLVLVEEHGAVRCNDVLDEAAAHEVGVDVAGLENEVVGHALGRAAVLLAHDNVLAHVDQTAREVTGVGGVRSGVDEALTSAVGRR